MLGLTPRVKTCQGELVIEISWSSQKLEKDCSTDANGRRCWGAQQWAVLKRRLAVLLAAPTLAHMDGLPGNCHALRADRAGEFAVNLWGPYRLIFAPDHDPLPRLPDGGLNRAEVTKIKIREVADYHGN
jgi:proteic killer suppression protein